jgi:hypothetical protein
VLPETPAASAVTRFCGLLDGGQRGRDALACRLHVVGDLVLRAITEPFAEQGDPVGREIP